MKHTKATIALSALLLVSLGSLEAKTRFGGVRRMFKDSAHSTRELAGTQIKTVAGTVAQVVDKLLYPLGFYIAGKYVCENWPEGLTPSYPPTIQKTIKDLPYGTETNDALVRIVTGCVAVAGAHAVLTTETMNNFVNKNMPNFSRLLNHVSTENGLRSRRAKEKTAAL